jgi:5-methylcytosine-specific restriction endonuclease McrA
MTKRLRPKSPSVKNRASTLWSEVVRMLNYRIEIEQQYIEHPSGNCMYCRLAKATTLDHFHPAGVLRDDPSPMILVSCCATCNSSKGSRPFGVWMVNKFGFNPTTLERICEIEHLIHTHAKELHSTQPSSKNITPEIAQCLKTLCYSFCEELHELTLRCRECV